MRTRAKLSALTAASLVVVSSLGLAAAQPHASAATHESVAAEAAGVVAAPPAGVADSSVGHHAITHGDAPDHADAAHTTAGHGSAEPPTLDQINWFYGFLGESDEVEPSLAYRPKGMTSPLLATLINWAIFVSLIVMLAKKQIPLALAKRKAGIVQGMNDAQKARDESAALLGEYESKLAKIDQDIERIKDEMRRAGEQERERILAEAVERRTRMERDARRLIETELDAAKESLRREIVQSAIASAKHTVESKLAASDQQRLFDEAIASLKKLPARSLGERA